jgi:hypothetical protein
MASLHFYASLALRTVFIGRLERVNELSHLIRWVYVYEASFSITMTFLFCVLQACASWVPRPTWYYFCRSGVPSQYVTLPDAKRGYSDMVTSSPKIRWLVPIMHQSFYSLSDHRVGRTKLCYTDLLFVSIVSSYSVYDARIVNSVHNEKWLPIGVDLR